MDEKTLLLFLGFVFTFLLELRSSKIGFTFTWNPILYLVVCSICKNFNNVEHPGNWMIAMWRISTFLIILMWQQWKPRLFVYLLFEKRMQRKRYLFAMSFFRLESGIYKVFFPKPKNQLFVSFMLFSFRWSTSTKENMYTFQSFSIQHSNLQSYHFESDVILHQLHSHSARSSRAFFVRYESGRDSKKIVPY